MHGLRQATADVDLAISSDLAQRLNLATLPRDEYGLYVPCPGVHFMDDTGITDFDIIDGYRCETLAGVLKFKQKLNRAKDQDDIRLLKQIV